MIVSSKGNQVCTQCHKSTNWTISNYWNCRQGQIIGKNESLCHSCANKKELEELSAINKRFKKILNKELEG